MSLRQTRHANKTWHEDENYDKYRQDGSDQAGIDSDQLHTVKRHTDQDRPATDQPKPGYVDIHALMHDVKITRRAYFLYAIE